MTNYHVNSVTGKYGVCRAKKPKNCPLGQLSDHYNNEEDAIKRSEAILADFYGTTNSITKKKLNPQYVSTMKTLIEAYDKNSDNTSIDFTKHGEEFAELDKVDRKVKSLEGKLETYKTNAGDNSDPEIIKTAENKINDGKAKAKSIIELIRTNSEQLAEDEEYAKHERNNEEGLKLFNESLREEF